MTKKDFMRTDNHPIAYFIVLIILIMFISNLSSADNFNLRDVNKITVYDSNGESLGRGYLQKIDDKYIKYLDSAYDYKEEIHEKDYVLSGSVKVKEVEKQSDGYKIKTYYLSGTTGISDGSDVTREMIIFLKDKDLDKDSKNYEKIVKLTNGDVVHFEGELNTMSDKFYVVNKIKKLEVE